MKTIYKYPIRQHTIVIDIPKGAKILSVINQIDDKTAHATVYAVVDTDEQEMDHVTFYLFGTGWRIGGHFDNLQFVGTVQEGWQVWHVFYDKWDQR